MKAIVTGCAGFIGSNLTDKLLDSGNEVFGIDNLSTGSLDFLNYACSKRDFLLYKKDLLTQKDELPAIFHGCDFVFHLAANADIKNNINDPQKNIDQNILVTYNVLEAMRKAKVKNIVFLSTGSVYGETSDVPTPETTALYPQTSLYSASKLAGEALVEAYCEGFGFTGYIYRLVSILGPRYHHGHVYDFYTRLKEDRKVLNVLGNGSQRKSYLHVFDCIEGIFRGITRPVSRVNIFNLGTDETITVKESVKEITNILGLRPEIKYGNEMRGWIGDNPLIYLDCSKIRAIGWKPKYSIKKGIKETVKYLVEEDEKNINNNRR